MSIAKLITLPNPHLRTNSQKVGYLGNSLKQTIQQMEEVTLAWEASREHEVGVALAAIQIDQPLRIVIIRNDFDNKQDKTFQVFINPTITKYEGEVQEDFEGCLSVTDLYGKVPRHTKVRIKALNLNGKEIRLTAEGFLARVFQHEIDHTNGVMFIDHIKDIPDAFYRLEESGKLQQLAYDEAIQSNSDLWS